MLSFPVPRLGASPRHRVLPREHRRGRDCVLCRAGSRPPVGKTQIAVGVGTPLGSWSLVRRRRDRVLFASMNNLSYVRLLIRLHSIVHLAPCRSWTSWLRGCRLIGPEGVGWGQSIGQFLVRVRVRVRDTSRLEMCLAHLALHFGGFTVSGARF
jgi:hypothetical protein